MLEVLLPIDEASVLCSNIIIILPDVIGYFLRDVIVAEMFVDKIHLGSEDIMSLIHILD